MASEQIKEIALENLVPGPGNRKHGGFDKAELEQLAESIKAVGILQPLVVRPLNEQARTYEIVCGERRSRAAKLAAMAKARGIKPVLPKPQVCRVCGCTEADCRQCIAKTGEPCHWVEPDLCSACAPKKKRGKKAAA